MYAITECVNYLMGEVCSSCPWDMTLKNIHTHTHTHTHPHSQTASKPPINRQELIFPITQSHHSLIGSPPHLTPLSPRKPLGKQRNGWCGCIGVVTLHPHTVCQLLVVVNSVNAGHSGVNVHVLSVSCGSCELGKCRALWGEREQAATTED